VAVVSAFEGVTDRLLEAADAYQGEDPATIAALLSTGEIGSAAHLTFALHEAGIPSRMVDPRDIELIATGDRANAELSSINLLSKLKVFLAETPVLVIPGFFALSGEGGLALLGRGGSDLTALFLAAELKAACILLKDVDGLYDADPARATGIPRRFIQADYSTAENCGGPLIQPKAIHFARDRSMVIRLARVGHTVSTRISEDPSIWSTLPRSQRLRVALLGLGTVGRQVLNYLRLFSERFEVVSILVRSTAKHAGQGVNSDLLTQDINRVFECEPDIVVDVLAGMDPARSCMDLARQRGVRVVTANKALLAAQWDSIRESLFGARRQIRYSATVGGAVPMLEIVERVALRSPIESVRGVINGTCNYVLDRCRSGVSFAQALRSAQERGFAEADCNADLNGLDSVRKLEILGRVAFGGSPTCNVVAGIDALVCRPKEPKDTTRTVLLAAAHRTESGFSFAVQPMDLQGDEFLAGATGAENRLEIVTRAGEIVRLKGLGAGGVPTATAVFADILDHAWVIDAVEAALGSSPKTVRLARNAARNEPSVAPFEI
jgi:homoserine dehydrogenase